MEKRIISAVLTAILLAGFSSEALTAAKPILKKAVYQTDLHCEKCAEKIRENISFEKGVRDLKIDVPTKEVEILFDSNKTDTLALKKAINKLGYDAKLVDCR